MTPEKTPVSRHQQSRSKGGFRTERVPDNQRKFRHLLSLLAKLHESCFSATRIEEFCDPDENFPILITDATIHHGHRTGQSTIPTNAPCTSPLSGITGTGVPSHGYASIVLLLSSCSGGCSRLDLGMLLGDQRRMRLLSLVRVGLMMLLLLLLQPGRISLRILVLVGKDVLSLRLKHGGPAKNRSSTGLVILRREDLTALDNRGKAGRGQNEL